ncbi:MAG: hypothetical protein HY754_01840, partial [Nitrospirae bacterium]|nr:hypothetical protein [Nitrospirota bacterium]
MYPVLFPMIDRPHTKIMFFSSECILHFGQLNVSPPIVGCLQILQSGEVTVDPHPELPKIFQDRKAVTRMVEKLKGKAQKEVHNHSEDIEEKKFNSNYDTAEQTKEKESLAPKVLKRLVLADIIGAQSFGYALYCKAQQYRLDTAERKAYIGDGDRKIWSIYEENFRADNWIPILDFVHAVEYAFESAKLSTENENACWAKYMEFVTHIWQGRTLTVIRRLDKTINGLESSQENKPKKLKDKVDRLKSIRCYFQNNLTKMNYSKYRKKGLPVSSCHVESLIKQFNIRIKSSEKFWNKSSVKGIIKLKASIFSNDDSYRNFWNNRHDYQTNLK